MLQCMIWGRNQECKYTLCDTINLPKSTLQTTRGNPPGVNKSPHPVCRYRPNWSFRCLLFALIPPSHDGPQDVFQKQPWGTSTLNKVMRNTWSDLSPSKIMEVANLNPSNRATFSSKPCSNNPWKVNPTTLCPLLEVKTYHQCLGMCYKVAYSITHNRKAKVWDIH